MPKANAVASCPCKPGFLPGRVAARFTRLTQALLTSKSPHALKQSHLLCGFRGREKPGEWQVRAEMCWGWLGTSRHSHGARMPGLPVSRLGLQLPREPPHQRCLKAFHFLLCLRLKVLSGSVKLSAFSGGAGAAASCCLLTQGGFFSVPTENTLSTTFPWGSVWLGLPGGLLGVQLAFQPAQGAVVQMGR